MLALALSILCYCNIIIIILLFLFVVGSSTIVVNNIIILLLSALLGLTNMHATKCDPSGLAASHRQEKWNEQRNLNDSKKG